LLAYGTAVATSIPKLHHLLPHLNPAWFYLSGTGLPRLSWKRGRLMGVVVVVTVVFVTIVSTQCLTLLVEKQKEASIV